MNITLSPRTYAAALVALVDAEAVAEAARAVAWAEYDSVMRRWAVAWRADRSDAKPARPTSQYDEWSAADERVFRARLATEEFRAAIGVPPVEVAQ